MARIGKAAVLVGLSAGLLLVFNPITFAQEQAAQIEAPERDSYLNGLKTRHHTQDERAALLAESNQLLNDNALTVGYQVGQAQNKREDLNYQLSLGGAGELVVREERRSADGALAVRHQSVELFGIEPFVRYECQTGASQSCVLFNPKDGSPWLTIVRNQQGAQQLSKALGFLI
ncbi:hypothetical protein AXE65_11905, partial [Ventosimonas gracilis]